LIDAIRIGPGRWEAVIWRPQTEEGVIEFVADRNGLKSTTFNRSHNARGMGRSRYTGLA
jgi:hypothetical protein